MKVLIIGGVAAGTKVAAKLKREDRSLDVLILTKGKDISYAGCGLPYYVGGVIPTREQLIVNTPESFSRLTGAEVQTETEVTAVDTAAKTVTAVQHGETKTYTYDKLVIAPGKCVLYENAGRRDRPPGGCGSRRHQARGGSRRRLHRP